MLTALLFSSPPHEGGRKCSGVIDNTVRASASRVLFCVGDYAVRLMPKISGISSLSLSCVLHFPLQEGGREHSSAIQASIYLPFGFLPLPPTSRKKERVIAVVSARLRGRAEDRGGTVGHCSSALPDIYCLPVSVATTHVCPPPPPLRYGRGRGLVCVLFTLLDALLKAKMRPQIWLPLLTI